MPRSAAGEAGSGAKKGLFSGDLGGLLSAERSLSVILVCREPNPSSPEGNERGKSHGIFAFPMNPT